MTTPTEMELVTDMLAKGIWDWRDLFNKYVGYYERALDPQLQPDVTYEEYRENARQQLERDRGAFTGETPLDAMALRERIPPPTPPAIAACISITPEELAAWTEANKDTFLKAGPHTYVGTLTWAEVV